MGSQWAGMGTHLMKIPVFAGAIHRCCEVLRPKNVDVLKIITDTDPKIFDNIINSFIGIAAIQVILCAGNIDLLYICVCVICTQHNTTHSKILIRMIKPK